VPEIVWLPESLADVERLHKFLKTQSVYAASRAVRLIQGGSDQLLLTPEIGRPMADGTERRELFLAFGKGAYVIRYMLAPPATAVVLRVWHSREDRMSITSPKE
jgi:plasmid stabilization system protein ParE